MIFHKWKSLNGKPFSQQWRFSLHLGLCATLWLLCRVEEGRRSLLVPFCIFIVNGRGGLTLALGLLINLIPSIVGVWSPDWNAINSRSPPECELTFHSHISKLNPISHCFGRRGFSWLFNPSSVTNFEPRNEGAECPATRKAIKYSERVLLLVLGPGEWRHF